AASVPREWSKAAIGASGQPAELATWWRGFQDPLLDQLVDQAVAGNLDLQLAQARIREARAARLAAASPLWPDLTGSASATRFHGRPNPLASGGSGASIGAGAAAGAGGGAVVTKNLFQAGLDSSWELDIFGGTRRGIESASAGLAASIEDQRAGLVSLLSELALDYIDLRTAQARLQIARDALTAEEETLALTRAKLEAGLGSALDVAEAEAAAATTRAAIPNLQTAARDAIHELSVLIGAPPETLASKLEPSAPIPAMSSRIALGLPAELLRRRPDIRAAERRVAEANADIGVAVANQYPSVTLAGSLGLNATRIGDLGDVSARSWSFGPGVTMPIFNAGKLAAEVDVKRARWDQAVIAYRATVLTAAREVEDAIAADENERVHRAALAQSVAAYRDALALARDLYGRGLTSFLNVLDAERSLYATQDQLAQSEAAVSANEVRLFKALGGGWTADEATADARAP
ncbi:MAG TPA: efflux transporter outer membrane subunit, partial [Stellaceae bacterium]|nr:efflux transporter outer membrane subunit [Stellaceae bacterium]